MTSTNGTRARLLGTGHAVPEKKLLNSDLEKLVDTNDEWIRSRTGIRERRMASTDDSSSSFAIPAGRNALERAGVAAADVDLVICATVTPDMLFPSTACLVQDALGATRAAAFDLNAGCSGFLYGLRVASQFIENGAAKTALVIGAELLTKFVDWTDRSTCVLFGDGAGAAVLQATREDRGILGGAIHSDGSLSDLLWMPGGGSRKPANVPQHLEDRQHFINMKGNETFKAAVRALAEVSEEALEICGLQASDVRWLIPHQANLRIIEAVGRRLDVPSERVYVNVERFGNTSAASIPIALDELHRGGQIDDGDVVLMAAFGAGLTWAATAIRF